MNEREQRVFDRLVELTNMKPAAVKKVFDLIGPVVSEQIGKGLPCAIPGFVTVRPTDALSERFEELSRRVVSFAVEDSFVDRAYRSYAGEPDGVISKIESRRDKLQQTNKRKKFKELYEGDGSGFEEIDDVFAGYTPPSEKEKVQTDFEPQTETMKKLAMYLNKTV